MNQDNQFWVHPQSGNLITPRVKLSYANLLIPKGVKSDPNSVPVHGATLLIPSTADMTAAYQVWQAACQRGMTGDGCDAWPPSKLNPATGQQEPYFGMANPLKLVGQDASMITAQGQVLPEFQQFTYFLRVRTYDGQPPGIMLPSGVLTTDPKEVYSGRWAVCSLQAFPYFNRGNYGVSFGIQNCQLLEHDDRIGGGRAPAETEFQIRSDVTIGMMPAPEQPQFTGQINLPPGAQPQPQGGVIIPAAVAPQPTAVQPGITPPGQVPQMAQPASNAYAQGMAPAPGTIQASPQFGAPPAAAPQPQPQQPQFQPQPGAPVQPGYPASGTPQQPAPPTTMQQPQQPQMSPVPGQPPHT